MIRPRKNMAPNFATFKVPLSFNKLDLRDYLWNVYNVRVLSVRSMVNQQAPTTKSGLRGQIYRPLSEKLMIAELDKPFVWPEAPAEEDRGDFDYSLWKKYDEERQSHLQTRKDMMDNKIPMRGDQPTPESRRLLAKEAEAILEGRKEWKSSAKLDEVWSNADISRAARTPRVAEEAGEPRLAGSSKDVDIIVEDDKPSRKSS
ncbi:hypothetical protein GQ53DRAFT_754708 [Thozetella sp. PMI_491]|nr:hypothetical protein GQ53DRAFT_754708 [Thozetella sp. PMI_491]